jgi:hypothetical protein
MALDVVKTASEETMMSDCSLVMEVLVLSSLDSSPPLYS